MTKENKTTLLAWIALLVYAIFRFSLAFQSGYTIAITEGPSDGMGTTSLVAFMQEQYQRNGVSFLTTTLMSNEDVGAGLIGDAFITLPWKWMFIALGSVVEPDNVYDGILALAFVLTIFFGAFVARAFGLRGWHAYAAGLLFALLQAFEKKAEGHLGLAIFFVSLAQIAWAKIAITRQDAKSFIILGLISGLTFVQNEYYGMFGSIFTASYLFSRYILVGRFKKFPRLLWNLLISALVCISVMAVFYFRLFFPENSTSSVSFSKAAHSIEEFKFYSVKNISEVFAYFPFSKEVINPENVFAIGSGIILLIFILAIKLKNKNISIFGRSWVSDICAISIASVIMLLVAIDFESLFSLGPVIYLAGPMFRVLLRALLFFDFGIIILFILLLSAANKWRAFQSPCCGAGIFLFLAIFSINGLQLLHPMVAYAMPKNAIYANIGPSDSNVLSLPFFGPNAPPESSYIYAYDYMRHRQPMVNGPFFQLPNTDPLIAEKLISNSGYINNLSDAAVKQLANAGIGAIVLEKGHSVKANLVSLERNGIVKELIEDDQGRKLIKLVHRQDGDFLFDFLLNQPYYLNISGCSPPSYVNGRLSQYCNQNFGVLMRSKKGYVGNIKIDLSSECPIQIGNTSKKHIKYSFKNIDSQKTTLIVSFDSNSDVRNNRSEIFIPLQHSKAGCRIDHEISIL